MNQPASAGVAHRNGDADSTRAFASPSEPRTTRLDSLDRKILLALRNHQIEPMGIGMVAGQPITRTWRKRIERLYALGVIDGFHARIDPRAFVPTIESFLQIALAPTVGAANKLLSEVDNMARLERSWRVAGGSDLLLQVRTENVEHLTALLQRITSLPCVRRVRTTMVLQEL